jgi:hypothetical protein
MIESPYLFPLIMQESEPLFNKGKKDFKGSFDNKIKDKKEEINF